MTFSEELKRLRKIKNLTQAGLATLVGSTREKIQKYENGVSEPPLAMVIKLADIFGVCVDQLIRGRESCPCDNVHNASVVRKAAHLSEKELKAVEKLMEELGEYIVGK